MANFSEFGNIFSDRYNRAVDAAEQQRVRDRGVEEHFHDQVFNGENTQVDDAYPTTAILEWGLKNNNSILV